MQPGRYGVGVSQDDAVLLREWGKQMVGKGFDPLPDADYPLEIEGAGISSVYKTLLPWVKKAYKYGKPLAKKIGREALKLAAGAAVNRLSDKKDTDPDDLPGKKVLDDIMSRGKSMAIDRAEQLKKMGVERLQESVDKNIDALQQRSNDAIDKMQSKARDLTMAGQAQVSTGIATLEARARARMSALRGAGIDHEEAHVMAYMGSGVRFADTTSGPRPGVRVATGHSPGAFKSGRVFSGQGMYRQGSGMYRPGERYGSGHGMPKKNAF